MKYSPKANKAKAIQSWLTKFQTEYPGIAYKLQGVDSSILEGMTLKQLQFVLSMTAAGYGGGSETSRQFWAPKYHAMREAAERATGQKDISYSGLRLVVSQ